MHFTSVHPIDWNVSGSGSSGRRQSHARRYSDQESVPDDKELAVRCIDGDSADVQHDRYAADLHEGR